MKSERYYIFVDTLKTNISKQTFYKVRDKEDNNKVIKTFNTMSEARNYKVVKNNG